jgi:hypothetical protein
MLSLPNQWPQLVGDHRGKAVSEDNDQPAAAITSVIIKGPEVV